MLEAAIGHRFDVAMIGAAAATVDPQVGQHALELGIVAPKFGRVAGIKLLGKLVLNTAKLILRPCLKAFD